MRWSREYASSWVRQCRVLLDRCGVLRPGVGRRRRDHVVHVDAGHALGVRRAELGGEDAAPVAALHAVALVPQVRHQRVERRGDARDAPAALARSAAEAEAGQGRDDEVELLAQRPEDPMELVDRARPAVEQQQRERVGRRAAHMPEVQVDAVDLVPEAGDRVELRLGRAPVVAVAPVLAELADRLDLRPVVPLRAGDRLGPARLPQPPPQVGQHGVGDLDAKGARHVLGIHGDRGAKGTRSSSPGWTTSADPAGTSCQRPGRSPSGSETTARASSEKCAKRSSPG